MVLSVFSPELEDKEHMDIAQADKETDILKSLLLTSSVSFVLIFIIITSSSSLPLYFLLLDSLTLCFRGRFLSLSLSGRQTIKDKQHFEH